MVYLIDKDALVAEIENLNNTYKKCLTYNSYEEGLKDGRLIGYKDSLHKINSIEVKEVDLEKELIEWHKEHFNKDGTFIGMSGFYLTNNSQMDIAKHFFELGLKAQKEE